MSNDTSFVTGTTVPVGWFNDVNTAIWDAIGTGAGGTPPATPANVRDNLGLTATSGSSLLGFLQAGTGASGRTIQAKARDVISVTDYAATANTDISDGVINASVAFQAAYDHVRTRGGMIFIPKPTVHYLLQTSINCTRENGASSGAGVHWFSLGPATSGNGSVTTPARCIYASHTGHVFDCWGNESQQFTNVKIDTDPAARPKTGWALGRNSAGSSCGQHRFTNCFTYAEFSEDVIYSYASEENEYFGCSFVNTYTGAADVVCITGYNIKGLFSTFINRFAKFVSGTGTFTNGETVTGGSSGATAVVSSTYGQSGANPNVTGTLIFSSQTGTWTEGETITGGTSGKTGVIAQNYSNITGNFWGGHYHMMSSHANANTFLLDGAVGIHWWGVWAQCSDMLATGGNAYFFVNTANSASDLCVIQGFVGENASSLGPAYGIRFGTVAKTCTGWTIQDARFPVRTTAISAHVNVTIDNFHIRQISDPNNRGINFGGTCQNSVFNLQNISLTIATSTANEIHNIAPSTALTSATYTYIPDEYTQMAATAGDVAAVSGEYTDVGAGVRLTEGEWDITAVLQPLHANASNVTKMGIGISTTSGNSSAGLIVGQNYVEWYLAGGTTTDNFSLAIPSYRAVVTKAAAADPLLSTYYLKIFSAWTVGRPKYVGALMTFRRIR